LKFFADLHLRTSSGNLDQTKKMIERSAQLGYDAVGIPFPTGARGRDVQRTREVCSDVGVDLVARIDLTPRRATDLLKNLRSLRRRTEIIAVRCFSKDVARQAAKDRRVDLLSFSSTDPRKRFFDSAEAELASGALTSLEVDMAPLLYVHGFRRIRLLTALRKEMLISKKFDVPIVLSSGADDPRLLRKPEDYACLSYLFGLDFHKAKQAFSENPQAIIERNRRKLSSDFVAPGVYIFRRGEDCPDM
jgi:RNase P/RNase MRP subunit p30